MNSTQVTQVLAGPSSWKPWVPEYGFQNRVPSLKHALCMGKAILDVWQTPNWVL